jgi:hypothetical protein
MDGSDAGRPLTEADVMKPRELEAMLVDEVCRRAYLDGDAAAAAVMVHAPEEGETREQAIERLVALYAAQRAAHLRGYLESSIAASRNAATVFGMHIGFARHVGEREAREALTTRLTDLATSRKPAGILAELAAAKPAPGVPETDDVARDTFHVAANGAFERVIGDVFMALGRRQRAGTLPVLESRLQGFIVAASLGRAVGTAIASYACRPYFDAGFRTRMLELALEAFRDAFVRTAALTAREN